MEKIQPEIHNASQLPEEYSQLPDNIQILGSKILIQLEKYESNPNDDKFGLLNPKFKEHASEEGKAIADPEETYYKFKGKIIQIPRGARTSLEKLEIDIQEGDIVWVSPHALSPQFFFKHRRDEVIMGDFGYFLIQPNYIEAKEL